MIVALCVIVCTVSQEDYSEEVIHGLKMESKKTRSHEPSK